MEKDNRRTGQKPLENKESKPSSLVLDNDSKNDIAAPLPNDNELLPVDRRDDNFAEPITRSKDVAGIVSVIVGKWAMPATVLLVLITCVSGYYLDEAKFTPVVGMIAPVVMALIMVIREASVGKDEDTTLLNSESERRERIAQYHHEKEVKLAQLQSTERIKAQEIQEQARQFDMFHASTKEFLELVRETNSKIAQQVEKPHSTELAVGDTKIKIGNNGTEVSTAND